MQEYLINKRQSQPKNPINIIRSEILSDPALCNLSEFDSDDNMDKEVLKERRERKRRESKEIKKSLAKLRISVREEKRLTENFR